MSVKQLTLADTIELGAKTRKKTKTQKKLETITQLVNWTEITDICKDLYKSNTKKGGRPVLCITIKVKLLFLQHLYNVSDECLEEFVIDNLSFQQFVGLRNSDSVPDFTTYWRFKEKIIANKLGDKIWDAINKQLEAQGAKIEPGAITLIDATIIESTQKPLSKEERTKLSKNPSVQKDTDATSTEKRGKKYFGYKGHIGVDCETKLIHSKKFTTAKHHDVSQTEHLASGTEKEIQADKGYVSRKLKQAAHQVGLQYNAMHKATKNRDLSDEEKADNKKWAKTRARVEHVFGYMKRSLNYQFARAKKLVRNELTFTLNCTMYNIFAADRVIRKKAQKPINKVA